MLKVALTGGIATGKSYIAARLREAGVPTIDADAIVHDILKSDGEIVAAIGKSFGPDMLNREGGIDRAALGRAVFQDAAARARLEAILHPRVYSAIREWQAGLAAPFCVASIPLLYETHAESDFDAVIVASCTREQQMQRLEERGLSADEARLRLAAQWPTDDKVARADFVISTSGTSHETDTQVAALVAALSRR